VALHAAISIEMDVHVIANAFLCCVGTSSSSSLTIDPLFLNLPDGATYDSGIAGFGGAAGPGKSKALLMEAVLQAMTHPGVNTLLLRRTFPELEPTLLHYFRRDISRDLYDNFNESKRVVTWENGSTTRFGYCAAENDVYQYQGAESFSSASTSSLSSLSASGNSSPAAIAAPPPARFRAWPARRIPATSATPG
jgi:hypothetical protein